MNETKINGEELVFGLDIGTRSVVGTVGYKHRERFVVVAQEIREHQTRAMLDGQIHDINRVAATIADIKQSLEDKTGITLNEVCIAAAGRVLETMNVHVETELDKERNVTKEDINTLISMGIEQAFSEFQEQNTTDTRFYCVGYSIVKYYLNGMWMGQPEHHKAKSLGADMIATFLPDDVVDGLYSAVEIAGLKVANLTLEPIAAIRVAIPEKYRLLNIAMVDIGAGTSDISVTNDGSVVAFGMIPYAGDSLTEVLAKTCLIDFATAEKIKTASTYQDKILYEDIMGIEQIITADEVLEICEAEIDKMSKLTADTIKELNGGVSPSAVFIVGGGGKIKGFDKKVAAELGLDPKRVAVRGEEIMSDVEFPDGALKDSTIITPIGICLTYYEQNNNFIYISFNGNRVKLYDNNKLTVMDAAMQAAFTRDGLFPRRGDELHYTVNGKNRIKRGEYGESAHVFVNGEEVNLNHKIKANDEITLEAATHGQMAQERIADLVDYNGKITLNINGEEMQLPKPATANGNMVMEDYIIQDGDEIELSTYYTFDGFCEYMGFTPDEVVLIVNDKKVENDIKIRNSDRIEIKNKKQLELQEIYAEARKEADKAEEINAAETPEEVKTEEVKPEEAKTEEVKEDIKTEEVEQTEVKEEAKEEQASVKAENITEESKQPENMEEKKVEEVKPEEKKTETNNQNGKKIIVIVNKMPVVMNGKDSYVFVDIFDYIDFDTTRMRGTGIVTKVNGKDAQYTQEIFNGDKIEVYWK